MSNETEGLIVEREQGGKVLAVTFDRAERRNALTMEMMAVLADCLEDATQDDALRVVVLRCNGRDFCSGADLGGGSARAGDAGKPRTGHLQRSLHHRPHRLIRSLDEIQLPVIAAVRGWVAGIGLAIAASADHVIATPDARFWSPFVGRGFTPDSGSTFLLPRLVGMARAKEILLRSKPIDAVTAERWGLIGRVVDEAEFEAEVAELVAEYAQAATVAVGLAKSLLHRNRDVELAQALHNEELVEELAIRSDDFKTGMKAFATRQEPDYTGW